MPFPRNRGTFLEQLKAARIMVTFLYCFLFMKMYCVYDKNKLSKLTCFSHRFQQCLLNFSYFTHFKSPSRNRANRL